MAYKGILRKPSRKQRKLQRRVALAMELKQHLFDTYHHAVAPETPDCVFVSADERYLRAAHAKGGIVSLTERQLSNALIPCSTER